MHSHTYAHTYRVLCIRVCVYIYMYTNIYIYIFFFFLAAPHSMQDLSSPTKDQTSTPCSGSAESQPLDQQGSPCIFLNKNRIVLYTLFYNLLFLFNNISGTFLHGPNFHARLKCAQPLGDCIFQRDLNNIYPACSSAM